MNYKTMVNDAYNKYVKDWCGVRGYNPSHIDPETGINGECYVCINEFERNEFQDEEYMARILSDTEYTLWQARFEFKDIFLKSLISRIYFKQKAGEFSDCPRCGRKMDSHLSHNSLSRRATVYVCSPCGTLEALEDAPFAELAKIPLDEWEFARTVSFEID